jgi:hypothetical protein
MQMNMPPGFMMGPGGGGVLSPHPMFMGVDQVSISRSTPLCILVCNNSNSNNLQGIHQADNNNNNDSD